MRTVIKVACTLVLAGGLAAPPVAYAETADLSLQFRAHGRPAEVGPERVYWTGIYWGASYNNAGEGFGHKAAWRCPAVTETAGESLSGKGYCTMTDADGDKAFGSFEAEGQVGGLFKGTQRYTGGTGKYDGIRGTHRFQCEVANIAPRDASIVEMSCIQDVEYTVPD